MLDGSFFLSTAISFVGYSPAPKLPLVRDPKGPHPIEVSPRPAGPDLAANPITRSNVFELDPNAKKLDRTRCPLPPANTAAFVDWLREINEFGEMTQRRLLSLYDEYCANAFEPVSPRRLQLQICACGVSKRRQSPKLVKGKYSSPTVYTVQPSQIARAAA